MVAFTKPGEVVLSWTDEEEEDGENYKRVRAAWEVLTRVRDAMGRRIRVRKLYLPSPMVRTSQRVFCERSEQCERSEKRTKRSVVRSGSNCERSECFVSVSEH